MLAAFTVLNEIGCESGHFVCKDVLGTYALRLKINLKHLSTKGLFRRLKLIPNMYGQNTTRVVKIFAKQFEKRAVLPS